MTGLVAAVIEAHGGLERWRAFSRVTARLVQGGVLWSLKGKAGVLDEVGVTVALDRQFVSHAPFGAGGLRSTFTPDLVTLAGPDGMIVEELHDPRASFAGHTLETSWSDPQLAYFAGCAMWTYLTTPFVLADPAVETEEIDPWAGNDGAWRRLRVHFPTSVATHSSVQTLYVDEANLLVRHDYDVEIAGGTPGAHFVSDYVDISGIKFPTKRRIFPRRPDGEASPEPLVVSIDLSEITLS
jgi:hypothetical protein